MRVPVVPCFESGPWLDEDTSTSCMLPAGHDGPHEWTRNDEIVICAGPALLAASAQETTGQPRFYIDHGMIHDRETGKHITTDEDSVFCDGINHCCALLNELHRAGGGAA